MNWVAHFVLSEEKEPLILGNWLGEFVRGKDFEDYTRPLQKGILLHREIDSYTDRHPIIKQATKIFHSTQGKYSPVVVDLIFDYFLIQNWSLFRNDSFEEFKNYIYSLLDSHKLLYPEKLRFLTNALLRYDWFDSYQTLDGIKDILTQMSHRTVFPNHMAEAVLQVKNHKEQLNLYFLEFFPDIQLHCNQFIIENE